MSDFVIQQCLRLSRRQAHMIQVYRDVEVLAATMAQYVSVALVRGDGVIMSVTKNLGLVDT